VNGPTGEKQHNSSPTEHKVCVACGQVTAPKRDRDGRLPGEWQERYDAEAKKHIRHEAQFVGGSFALYLACIAVVAYAASHPIFRTDPDIIRPFAPQVLAFLGGSLGGALFAMKWLYHSLAKNSWNLDRRLWRYFTPTLSGGAALCVVLLSTSGALPLFGSEVVRSPSGALGVSIVLGYFSDRVFSALEGFAKQNMPESKPQVSTPPPHAG
jgi:hypothetical protein